jgi:hypothetical protein
VGIVLPFRRPEPRRSRLRQAHPIEDPYWLADALHLRAAEAWDVNVHRLRPDRSDDDEA